MLSLPFIPPRPDSNLWPLSRLDDPNFDTSPTDQQNPQQTNSHRRPNSQHGPQNHSQHSALAALTADENVIFQRKQNVRRFGAGWIRPPGVAKTYQATMDEAAEREEQEILAAREQAMMDLQAAQTEAAARAEAMAAGEEDEMMEGERDLDDDVPEAEEDVSDVSEDEVDESAIDGDTMEENTTTHEEGDMTFNEDSFIEGSMVAAEVEHMLEMEEAEMAGVLQEERDLDDDIPEAGSYEHTDTELDDESSDVEDTSFVPGSGVRSARRRSSGHRRSGGLGMGLMGMRPPPGVPRSSLTNEGSSSLLDGSSFLRSSPAAGRAGVGAGREGAVRSRYRGSRSSRGY